MRYLLDTHIIFRAAINPDDLASRHLDIIKPAENDIYVSVVSLWEMVIKRSLGRLNFPDELLTQMEKSGYQLLPITVPDVLAYSLLSRHHRDPFDLMLVAQARAQNLSLVTEDREMRLYSNVITVIS